MIRKLSAIVLLGTLCGCSSSPGGSSPPGTSQDPPGSGSTERPPTSLRINEVMGLTAGMAGDEGQGEAWIEVINDGNAGLRLNDFVLMTGRDSWQMPDAYLEPGALYVLQSLENLEASAAEFPGEGFDVVAIVERSSQLAVDRVTLPATSAGESVARYPNGAGRFFVYPAARVTFGDLNPDIGFVNKLASSTEFMPRDSSPNAILRYDGFLWILGGWGNFGGDDWHSFADVWRSEDGVHWTLVNAAPPYDHYCSYVVWRGRMWAVGPSSFSSTDGVHWTPETIQSGELNRSVVFGDTLINIRDATVSGTRDGGSWFTLTDSAPWGMLRQKPAVVVYRDRIWLIGGVSDYGTPNETIHNDVWASGDGKDWELISAGSRWTPRIWASVAAYDDKIFLLNGSNRNAWPEENGNSSEIWFTDNGVDWLELKSENIWGARHASFSVPDDRGGLMLLAGFGHGGVARMYNDAWTLKASIYFSKPAGDLHEPGTWGRNLDGSGDSPAGFSDDNQVFVLRNRAYFAADERWSVTGAGSRILVGDGDSGSTVRLELDNRAPANQPLYLYPNSTTIVRGSPPTVFFQDPGATLVAE